MSLFDSFAALKNVTDKAGELLEKKKGEVSSLADEKKKTATGLLEDQVTKTTDALSQTKKDAEKLATDSKDEVRLDITYFY
jgi:gas vesicle protein